MAGLLSVAPENMHEDEHAIAAGYRAQRGILLGAMLFLVAAYYLDLKYVVAFGCVGIFGAVSFSEARLYDLGIRLKRSNHLAADKSERLEQKLDQLRNLV